MTQTYRKVRIFVASPGDVSEERARLACVVESMNRTGNFAEQLGLTLELLRWETHVTPDVGRTQQVVFDQLDPRDWDIFVGILWMRFGTPTGQVDPDTREVCKSGTEEEFKEALRRRKTGAMGWPKIMFYRCVRPIPPPNIDIGQYSQVQRFFSQFHPGGEHPGLVKDYSAAEEFERLIREDLEKTIWEYVKQRRGEPEKSFDSSGFVDEEEGRTGQVALSSDEIRTLTVPNMLRYILDRCLPRVHTWLTTRVRLFKLPPEWRALHEYLSTLHSAIANDITEKTYVEPHAKDLPEGANRFRAKQTGFLTPTQQLIKEILGLSHGGDAQNAQISALSKKSKFVRNLVNRLLKADEPLILLGDPGTGKSITLQQTALLIAEKERKRVFPKVCLFIRLGEFRLSGEQTVWDYVLKVTPPQIRPYIDSLGTLGRLVIFFDGMDEMSRERYNDYTTALSIFAGSKKEEIKTLFSCRITDFTPKFQHNRLVLLPFSRSQIYHYLKRQILFPINVGGRSWSARLLAKQLAQGELPMQADNPFVLWLLCTYLQEEEDWPKSRVHLLEYYNRLNYQRKQHDAELKGEPMPDRTQAFLTWGQIAYEITRRNKGAALPLADVVHCLGPEDLPAVQAGIRCGVLQESLNTKTPLIRFEHHRFQEYFTALYLDQKRETMSEWLDKLDAPRWQETLFNLVLMGGGQDALMALNDAIMDGLAQLEDAIGRRSSKAVHEEETLLADRVELASRVLQRTQNRPDPMLEQLSATFRKAAYWLADHGNPITKIKMLLASKTVPGIDTFRVAREALASDVSWVRQQALVITSVAGGEVGEGALQNDILHSFASGRFLNRCGGFVRIASATKKKQHWAVLAMGLILCLLQLLAGFGMVAIARHEAAPSFAALTIGFEHFGEKTQDMQERKAKETNDEEKLKQIDESRQKQPLVVQRRKAVHSAVQKTLDSWWFSPLIAGAMLMSLLYTLRRAPGIHILAMQGVGYTGLLLPFLWWPLWVSNWTSVAEFILLILFTLVPILGLISLASTLLIQSVTLILFVASSLHWTGTIHKKRSLFEAMWENGGFSRIWRISPSYAFYPPFFMLLMIGFSYGEIIEEFICAKFGLLTSLPPLVNIALSAVIYAELVGCLVGLVLRVTRRHETQKRNPVIKWTKTCVILFIVVLLMWLLTVIDWNAVVSLIIEKVGFLAFLPPAANAALSIAIYLEIIGCLVSLVIKRKKRQESNALEVAGFLFIVWTCLCFGWIILLVLGWLLALVNWKAIWTFLAPYFGLLAFLPPAVNFALTIAIYVETIGCLVSLLIRLKKGYQSRERSLKVLKIFTWVCMGLIIATLMLWGLYTVSDQVARLLALIISLVLLVILVISLRRLILDTAIFDAVLRWQMGYGRYNRELWAQKVRTLNPSYQARLLRRTTPEALGLSVNDFLTLLQEVEGNVQQEPALSAYWAKRYQIEQIVRQERVG
jgi:hypothetical protein